MSSDDLFINDNNEQTKTAVDRIPVDIDEWPVFIQEKLMAEHPFLSNFNMKVDLKKVDKENQAGFGAVVVEKNDENINIPVIIEDGKLQPFDVMIHDEKPAPLTKKRVNEVFSSFDIADKTVEDDERGDYFGDDIHDEQLDVPGEDNLTGVSGSHGKLRTASAEPGKILDSLDGQISEDDKKAITEKIAENELLAKFAKNGGSNAVKKLTNLNTFGESEKTAGIDHIIGELRDDNVFLLKEASPDQIKIISSPNRTYAPKQVTLNSEKAKDYVKTANYDPEVIDLVNPNQDVALIPDRGKDRLKQAEPEELEQLDEFGKARSVTKEGDEMVGEYFPTVVNFDNEKTAQTLFVSDDGFGYQDKVAGNYLKNATMLDATVKEASVADDSPSAGDQGCFVYGDEDGAIATEPFEVDQMAKVGNQEAMYISDNYGQQKAVLRTPNIESLTKIANPKSDELSAIGEEIHLVPEKMRFVKLSNERKFINNESDYATKQGDGERIKVSYVDGTFNIEEVPSDAFESADTPEQEKLADMRNLNQEEARFMLGNMGYSYDESTRLLKEAQDDHVITDYHAEMPKSEEEIRSLATDVHEKLAEVANEVNRDLVKEAAEISDPASVDAMLSLTVANEDNIQKYVENLDTFQEVLNQLAEMLLISRIGGTTLPEKSLKKAMENIEEVVDALHELETTVY